MNGASTFIVQGDEKINSARLVFVKVPSLNPGYIILRFVTFFSPPFDIEWRDNIRMHESPKILTLYVGLHIPILFNVCRHKAAEQIDS